ncbi:MAG: hypothetical protein EOO29_17035 [Comamonadaceae bacterium]|nr:MAG: hypothetical protein EOO29_17035 [Comamonadaceae bacterium]
MRANANALTSVASGNGSDNSVRLQGVDVDASTAVGNQQTNSGSRIWATLGTDAVAYTVGAVANGGSTQGSQLSVNGNSGLASATANAATNELAVRGATLTGNVATASSTAGLATADHVLSNDQRVSLTVGVPSGQRALANGLFTAQGDANGLLAGNSSLSVSNNQQDARALGNTATNTLSLAGTTVDSRSVLASSQVSNGSVTSDSLMTLSAAPSVSTQSAVTLDNNRNTALAITNRAFNTVQAAGANVGPASGGQALATGTQTSAAHVLSNFQAGNGEQAVSYASTSLNNFVTGALANNSSLAATDNVTWAESVVNYAANRLDVTGSANLGGAAALQNTQNSLVTGGVTATSQTNMSGNRGSFGVISASASSVALNDNSTVALAYGNSAANALNAVAGASYAPGSGAAPANVTPYNVLGAQYALLNTQANTSNVTANSSAIYEVGALNALTATNSGLNVAGNSVAAVAYGNSASNALQVAALNSGTPTAALSNAQNNVGAITASASGSAMGINGLLASNSSLAVRGNQITATAVGNSSTSSVLAAR